MARFSSLRSFSLTLALCTVFWAQGQSKFFAFRNVGKAVAWTTVCNSASIGLTIADFYIEKVVFDTSADLLLNEDVRSQQLITSLLNIYGSGKKIPLYAPQQTGLLGAVNAKSLSDQKIQITPFLAEALQDSKHPYHFVAQGVIGHEIGHILHDHSKKRKVFLSGTAATTFTLTQAFLCLVPQHLKLLKWLARFAIISAKNTTARAGRAL